MPNNSLEPTAGADLVLERGLDIEVSVNLGCGSVLGR